MNRSSLFLIVLLLVSFTVQSSFGQTQITLNTDKPSYGPGDMVQITGNAGSPNQFVAIQVKDPSGNLILIRTVQADSNGNFSLQFKVPTSATSGNFVIVANSRINGQVESTTKTIMQTVPEFGQMASIVMVIGVISAVVMSRKIRS